MTSLLADHSVGSTRRDTAMLVADGTIVVLEGVAWDHPVITYAMTTGPRR